MNRRGLIVGKFCPLHRGHMLLIDHARARCGELVIISYTKPEFERCDRAARAGWFGALYPDVQALVIDDAELARLCAARGIAAPVIPHNDADAHVHRAFVGWLCTTLLETTVDTVFTSEDYGDGFAAALAGHFGTPVGHVCVDRARSAVSVSGTMVRADPHRWREYLAPEVAASFVRRVALLGGESSGKTTLARTLAAEFGTTWVPEFGRTLWEERGGELRFDDMAAIAREQVRQEAELQQQSAHFLFCDSTALTTLFYSLEMFGRAAPDLVQLAQRRYDTMFLCSPDFPFVQDGTRRDATFRMRQHAWYVAQLDERGIDYVLLTGSVGERLEQVRRALHPGGDAWQ